LLFTLFIKALPSIVTHSRVLMYADDVKLFLSYNNIESGFCLQSDINRFEHYRKPTPPKRRQEGAPFQRSTSPSRIRNRTALRPGRHYSERHPRATSRCSDPVHIQAHEPWPPTVDDDKRKSAAVQP